jgi:UDP-galactopyranose mutase
MRPPYDIVIVGAGFAGAVSAERLASAGRRVLLIDKRPHIAGNAFDERDLNGLMIHRYGPHIFHTNSKRVFEYLSRFTWWRFYEHRVLAMIEGQTYPVPINRTTINRLYGLSLDEKGVERFLERVREPREPIITSEDVVLSNVGRDLCEKIFRGYTKKQWGLDLSQLSAGVAARIPTRSNDDDRYFTDDFQFMPAEGYSAMFARMLDHPNIDLQLNTDFIETRHQQWAPTTIYTGPIDQYFDCRFGPLPYRSLRFEHVHFADREFFQDVGTVNFPNDNDFTRVTEFKHLTGERRPGTSIVREYPTFEGDPYYPIPRPDNELLYKKYVELSKEDPNVLFVGRLAQYRYYNMDQVVGAALSTVAKVLA